MIGQLLKKNIFVLMRNKHIFVILLLMPIVLISILGFALSDMMNQESSTLEARVFLVEHSSEKADAQRFIEDLQQSALPAEAQEGIATAVPALLPIQILKEHVFASEELQENIMFKIASPDELSNIKKSEDASVIIEVPEGFTYQFLQQLFLGQGEKPVLLLLQNEGKQISSGMVEEILANFQEQYALSAALQEENMSMQAINQSDMMNNITITEESVDKRPIVSALTYYTFGMSTMFVFYVASSIASMAFLERDNHVYNRILLSNVSRWSYVSSVACTGLIFSFCQLGILFAFMVIFYGVEIPDLSMLVVITIFLSFSISGFTALLTALSFRSGNANSFVDMFQSVVVTVLAFLGGSFFPIEAFKGIGQFTPNGAALQAYLLVFQEYDWEAISGHMLAMFIYGVVLLGLAVVIFPRKERA